MDDYEIGTWFRHSKTEWMLQYQGDNGKSYTFGTGIPGLIIGPTLELMKKSFNPKMLVLYIGQEHILYGK